MIEPIMYFGIGFLAAALLCLLFLPAVHNRAVRLTMKRLEASIPLSLAEVRADKDQLRAEFAISARRLEMKIDSPPSRIWAVRRHTTYWRVSAKDCFVMPDMIVAVDALGSHCSSPRGCYHCIIRLW
jgi:hypothetical protein